MASDPLFPPAADGPTAAPEPATDPKRKPYVKLPGRMASLRLGASGIKKLYLGDDHLLQVDTVFFVEHYKRFAYTDIQSLVLRQTSRGLIMSLILGLLALLFGLCGLGTDDIVGRSILWSIAGFWMLLLIVNLVRSATCRCHLETAIGPQPLLSLSRSRPARQAFGLLAERIKAAQGTLEPEEAARQVDEMRSQPGSRVPGAAAAASWKTQKW